MLLAEVAATSAALVATRSRREKIALLAECLGRMAVDEVAIGACYLAGEPRQPRLDVGWRTLAGVEPPPADRPALTLAQVDGDLERVAEVQGKGSRAARVATLERLLGAATAQEQGFLRGLVLGELRQGALAGLLAQGMARAWEVPESLVRRALMLRADAGAVAQAAATGGAGALLAFRLTLFRPLQPMLAQTAVTVAEAVADLASCAVEYKLDGARVQAHRSGEELRIYSRNLRELTDRMPEVVALVRGLAVDQIVLDGEVLALRTDGRPQPFQDTMRRVGTARTLADRAELIPYFFDCLHLDGVDLLDEPFSERRAALARVLPPANLVAHHRVDGADGAAAALAEALGRGHEGVVVKDLDAVYEAGRRGAAWRKVKPTHTLDLVVLAAEWGSGRRRGWLSNLHLGARDPSAGDPSTPDSPSDGFVMLGKTFKGMTDHLLGWQTTELLAREVRREGHIVHVRPELVVEIAFDGVQASPRYPGGVTLRFARVKRYRDDKSPGEADTIEVVRALHARGK